MKTKQVQNIGGKKKHYSHLLN